MTPVWELGTPKNISYLWGFGSLLAIIMVIQIASGVLLAMYYVRGTTAWASIIEITREVMWGWLLRLIHGNVASYVFMVLFIHFFRGIFYCSFYLSLVWLTGWLIIFITMAAAFLGYVLPWGQMSFWGATVIINLLSILPIGKKIVIWLWGGFYVSNFTCRFFYAVHFLVPFIILVVVLVHLLFLHFRGSTSPRGSTSNRLKIKFGHIFLYKDVVNLILIWILWLWSLIYPDWSADPVNFIVSDLSNSPLHIQPEWYFLHFYAVLRSIPNKLGGLIGFAAALMLLILLAYVNSDQSTNCVVFYKRISWLFLSRNLILMWLGSQPVEDPFIFMGQIRSAIYFSFIVRVIWLDEVLAKIFNLKEK
jgi:quinol-cytochrome oxidoreductase complex cytochrome b subunit